MPKKITSVKTKFYSGFGEKERKLITAKRFGIYK